MIDMPPPGFSALDPGRPVTVRRRLLPHWRQDDATYFVTFRLADSLPTAKLNALRDEREHWMGKHPKPTEEESEAFAWQRMAKIERWLDQGMGACVLRHKRTAEIIEGRLRHFDGSRYDLFSFVIMPNHIHVCVKPRDEHGLDETVQAWKSVSAVMINREREQSGHLWQEESFDRIVRDTPHLRRVVKYIEANPKKAGIEAQCWTTPARDAWMAR
jgi:REP element-mobilizing transposase RayT